MPLAIARRSGDTSSCWQANILPVRPKPVATSSTMSSVPCRSHSSRTRRSQPSGSISMPAAACTSGSTTTPATSSPCAASTASSDSRQWMSQVASSLPVRAAVAVGVLRAQHVEDERPERLVEALDAADRDRAERVAVVGVAQRHEAGAPARLHALLLPVLEGDLQRDLDRGRAVVAEEHAREPGGRDRDELRGELDRRHRRQPEQGRVRDLVELLVDARAQGRVVVAVQVHPERGDAVEVAVPLGVDQVVALAALDHHGLAVQPLAHLRERVPERALVARLQVARALAHRRSSAKAATTRAMSAARVRAGRRQPDARGAVRHRRVADALRVDAALEQRLGQTAWSRSFSPTSAGTICVVEPRRVPARRAQSGAQLLGALEQELAALGLRAHDRERRARRAQRRRRQRAGEDEAARRVDQLLAQHAPSTRRTRRSCRRPCRGCRSARRPRRPRARPRRGRSRRARRGRARRRARSSCRARARSARAPRAAPRRRPCCRRRRPRARAGGSPRARRATRARSAGSLCRNTRVSARASLQASTMLAWLSESLTITSSGPHSAVSTPRFAM